MMDSSTIKIIATIVLGTSSIIWKLAKNKAQLIALITDIKLEMGKMITDIKVDMGKIQVATEDVKQDHDLLVEVKLKYKALHKRCDKLEGVKDEKSA